MQISYEEQCMSARQRHIPTGVKVTAIALLCSTGLILARKHLAATASLTSGQISAGYTPLVFDRTWARRIQFDDVIKLRLQGPYFACDSHSRPTPWNEPIVISDKKTIADFILALRHAEIRSDLAVGAPPGNCDSALEIILRKPIPQNGAYIKYVFHDSTADLYPGPLFAEALRPFGNRPSGLP